MAPALTMLQQLEKLKDCLVIVEGIKDKAALEQFNIKNIITLNCPLYQIPERLPKNCKEVVILTDLDKAGKRLYSKIKKLLTKHRIKINDTFRNFLFKETKLRQIQGLTRYLRNSERFI